jgi:hypothetical protein
MADQPFLSSLEKDRAPRVRALAARLLARIGASSKNPALEACLERIQKSQSGLIWKRTTLQLELPANVKDQAGSRWIQQTFAEVSVGELAGAFQLTENQLIEAAAKDGPLLLGLALAATNERRLDLLELVVAHLPNAWERMFEAGLDTLGTMTESERHRWQEIVVHPYGKNGPAAYALWDWLHRIADQEAPPSVISLAQPERGNAAWLELMAAMCPASQRQQLREQLTEFDQAQTVTPLLLLEVLDEMEQSHV